MSRVGHMKAVLKRLSENIHKGMHTQSWGILCSFYVTTVHNSKDLDADAIEAHSCVDPLMPNSFLSKTQLLMINQLQDVSTRRSLSTTYRKLTKTFGSKRPAADLSLTVVFCSRKNLASARTFVWLQAAMAHAL